jgi:hypothetical protein
VRTPAFGPGNVGPIGFCGRLRQRLARHRCCGRGRAPKARALPRVFNRLFPIERLLPRRNLGDGLIDQALPPLLRDRFGGSTFKKFPLAALTFKTRLVVAQAAVLLLLRGMMMVLPALRIVVAVALRRAGVARWRARARGALPLGIGVPVFRQIVGAGVRPGIVVGAVATIGRWRRRARPRLMILVASGPFRFVSTLRLARSFAIAVAMIQSIVARYRLPAWFLGRVLVKGTFSIATTQTAPALAVADLPLWLI